MKEDIHEWAHSTLTLEWILFFIQFFFILIFDLAYKKTTALKSIKVSCAQGGQNVR